jgi:hypothetical protein
MTGRPAAVASRLVLNAASCPFVFEYDGDRIADPKLGIGFAIDDHLVFDHLAPYDSLSDAMTSDPDKSQGDSEVFRFAGIGTVLLISLLAFIGLYPLLLGNVAGRIAGGALLAIILVSSAVTASKSRAHRVVGIALAISALGLRLDWLVTHNTTAEAIEAAIFAIFFLYTALIIFRHVLSFGPVYADRVHAALSVYILLALSWACIYAFIEIISPGSFSLVADTADAAARPQGAYLFADMIHLSIATLTSTGYGDILPLSPFARSVSQLEQLLGVFYIAVLISRLVGIYPSNDRV